MYTELYGYLAMNIRGYGWMTPSKLENQNIVPFLGLSKRLFSHGQSPHASQKTIHSILNKLEPLNTASLALDMSTESTQR